MRTKLNMRKGFTLIELMIVVAIIGILAAIAIPNFIKFQARSKQGEAKANLKAFFTAQKSFIQEKDRYDVDAIQVGFTPERGNRYGYYFGSMAAATGEDRTGVTVARPAAPAALSNYSSDLFKFPTALLYPVYLGGAMAGFAVNAATTNPPGDTPAGLGGVCGANPGCEISAVAAGNIDNDGPADSWYVATKDATGAPVAANCNVAGGAAVPAGVPFNNYNDVDCP